MCDLSGSFAIARMMAGQDGRPRYDIIKALAGARAREILPYLEYRTSPSPCAPHRSRSDSGPTRYSVRCHMASVKHCVLEKVERCRGRRLLSFKVGKLHIFTFKKKYRRIENVLLFVIRFKRNSVLDETSNDN